MSSIEELLIVGIHITFLVTGVLGNLFILVVNFLVWLETHDSNPSVLIINSIALISIFFQGAITFNTIISYMFVEFYVHVWVLIPLVLIMCSLSFSSLWCSTCLCFYYCIKIVNFNGSFFYKLKAKVPVLVPWLLIISIAASWAVGLSAFWDLYVEIKPVTVLIAGNETLILTSNLNSRCKCIFQIYMLFAAVAFSIILITATTIVTSLCKHMIRMKKSNEGSGKSRIHSHLSAAKTVISLLLLYLIFYGFLSTAFNEAEHTGNPMFKLSFVVISSFPTFNSIILIMGNRKLLTTLKKLLGIRSHAVNSEVTVTIN